MSAEIVNCRMFAGIQDLIAVPVWGTLLLLLAVWLRSRFEVFQGERHHYLTLLILKLLSGILLGIIYMHYYGYGDTLRYFFSGSVMREVILQDPAAGFIFLFGSSEDVPPDLKETAMLIPYWKHQASALLIARISAVLSLLTWNSYYANTLFFSFFSFTGTWVLYKTLKYYLPQHAYALRYAVLYLPSLIFWGSGLFKDPLALGLTGWMIYSIHTLTVLKTRRLLPWLILLCCCIGLFYIKVYILLAWLPFVIIWLILEKAEKLKPSPRKRKSFLLISGISGLALTLMLVQILTTFYPQFALELLMESIVANRHELLYTDQYYSSGYGSRFDIGEFDASFTGILKKIPAGIFAALFRPGLWDIRSLIMIPAALENTLILFFFLRWIWNIRLAYLFSGLQGKPAILTFFVFSILFSCFVGLSTSNFGTMLRYRLPAIPFFLAGLIALSNTPHRRLKSEPIQYLPPTE